MAWGIVRKVASLLDSWTVFALLKLAFTQQGLDIRRIAVKRRVVEGFQGRVVAVLPELLALAAEDILVKDDTDGDCSVMQWDEPGPARLIFHPQCESACDWSK